MCIFVILSYLIDSKNTIGSYDVDSVGRNMYSLAAPSNDGLEVVTTSFNDCTNSCLRIE